MDDLGAVMDAAGSSGRCFWASLESARLAILFAATYPERTSGLILLEPSITRPAGAGLPVGAERRGVARADRAMSGALGPTGLLRGARASSWAPTAAEDAEFVDWFVTHLRRGLSPGAGGRALPVRSETRTSATSSPRSGCRRSCCSSRRSAARREYVADRVAKSELVELPRTARHLHLGRRRDARGLDRRDQAVRRPASRRASEPDRVLATVLFTDIVGSTRARGRAGRPRAGASSSSAHHALVRRRARPVPRRGARHGRRRLPRHFDGPARAIRCACAIRDERRASSGSSSAPASTPASASCVDGKLSGIAVHTGARVAAAARPGRGARLVHRQGSRRRLGHRVRGPRRARAEGRAGRMAALRCGRWLTR